MVCDQTATAAKGYIVSNSLPYCDYKIEEVHNNTTIEEECQHTDNQKILLLLILSHILMTNSSVTEGMLGNALTLGQLIDI